MTTLGHRLCIVERDEARRECERLRGLLAAHGIDPDVVDVRPENDETPGHPEGQPGEAVRR